MLCNGFNRGGFPGQDGLGDPGQWCRCRPGWIGDHKIHDPLGPGIRRIFANVEPFNSFQRRLVLRFGCQIECFLPVALHGCLERANRHRSVARRRAPAIGSEQFLNCRCVGALRCARCGVASRANSKSQGDGCRKCCALDR